MASLACSEKISWGAAMLSVPPCAKEDFQQQLATLRTHVDTLAADPSINANGVAILVRGGTRGNFVAFCAAFMSLSVHYTKATYFGADGADEHLFYIWAPGPRNCPDGVVAHRRGTGCPTPFVIRAVFADGLFSEGGGEVVCEYTMSAAAGMWAPPPAAAPPAQTARAKKRAREKERKRARAAEKKGAEVADRAASLFADAYADADADADAPKAV
jgi:hypothetical protein